MFVFWRHTSVCINYRHCQHYRKDRQMRCCFITATKTCSILTANILIECTRQPRTADEIVITNGRLAAAPAERLEMS